MNDQYQTLHHGQFLGQKGVEENCKGRDCNDEHGSVPALKDIAGFVQIYQALNDCAGQERDGYDGTLPSGCAEPACASQSESANGICDDKRFSYQ